MTLNYTGKLRQGTEGWYWILKDSLGTILERGRGKSRKMARKRLKTVKQQWQKKEKP